MAKKKEPPRLRRLGVSEFKSHCLAILSDVDQQKEQVVLTKRGREFARIIPSEEPRLKTARGLLKGILKIKGDLVHLDSGEWEGVAQWDRIKGNRK